METSLKQNVLKRECEIRMWERFSGKRDREMELR